MGTAVIVEAVRTPIGKRGGRLAGLHPAELLGAAQTRLWSSGAGSTRRGRAGGRRLRHPGGRAVEQRHPHRLAARRAAPPDRVPDPGRPVRLGPAGRAPDRRPDRGRRHRRRHRLRGRGDEPGPAGRQRRLPGSARPGPRPGTSTCRTSSRRPSGSRSAAGCHRADLDAFGLRSQQQRRARLGARAASSARSCRSRRRCSTPTASRPARAAIVDRDQGLRETTPEGLAGLQAGAAGRPAHRGHVLADLRRRRRGAARRRGQGARARPAARGRGSWPSAWSAPTRTTTSTARSPRPSGCCSAAACRSATSTCSRSTRRSRRSCCPGQSVHEPDPDRVNVNGGAIALGHPVGQHRRPADHDRAARARAARREHRAGLDVRGRRDGHRHHHRADLALVAQAQPGRPRLRVFSSGLRMLAADRDDLAGQVRGVVAGQEDHHVGDLPRLRGAAERLALLSSASSSSLVTLARNGCMARLGATALTRMPCGATSMRGAAGQRHHARPWPRRSAPGPPGPASRSPRRC